MNGEDGFFLVFYMLFRDLIRSTHILCVETYSSTFILLDLHNDQNLQMIFFVRGNCKISNIYKIAEEECAITFIKSFKSDVSIQK